MNVLIKYYKVLEIFASSVYCLALNQQVLTSSAQVGFWRGYSQSMIPVIRARGATLVRLIHERPLLMGALRSWKPGLSVS